MPEPITEWEFTADVAGWINLVLSQDSQLAFREAKCEQRGSGSAKRRDLTLLDRSGKPVLTGEVKLPYQKDGGTPYNTAVVNDARAKARRAGARLFFTWNVNECVLWETDPPGGPEQAGYSSWKVTTVRRAGEMAHPAVQRAVKDWLSIFLREVARVLHGTASIAHKAPDERFIDRLESALERPIALGLEELTGRYAANHEKAGLDRWMRDEQGWTLTDSPEGIRDLLERAARFACYALVNKLVFHEALLKRYGARMHKLNVPPHLDTGEGLRLHLEGLFAEAKQVTGDYEAVFGEDHSGLGNLIPFYSDAAVPHWRELIEQIHEFDFSRLDYEVIGAIFERLISPEERHKYGQFYTRVEVVDLVNSFCIRRGDETVMDPSCGGGTFLVRAYARKRELAPGRSHGERLAELYGVDISPFATHLTTINLATRDLVDEANYPRVVRDDFFDVKASGRFISLPRTAVARGLGRDGHVEVHIPALDAVIGNPPYVRQEDIPKSKKPRVPQRGTKEFYQRLAREVSGADLSGRSDLHCYFWPHAMSFLRDDGYLCFLTSSQWLDVEYGFRLQGWILRNFEIAAVLESVDEPWFVGARVATTVTILRRQKDAARRASNPVRFVQLRRPIREVLAHDGTTVGAMQAADAFRDEVLALTDNTANDRYRARLVRQGDLWDDGVRLGVIMGKHKLEDTAGENGGELEEIPQRGSYYGGKWGVHLRAPDVWFALLDRFGTRFAPLGELAEIRRGVTSGKDVFFFPKDASAECLAKQDDLTGFEAAYGVPRRTVEAGTIRLVHCGEGYGEIRAIEAEYLEPEVHSLMEVDGFRVAPEDCSRMILLVSKPKEKLRGTHVLRYIQWGESQGWHAGETTNARVTEERTWYDLTGHHRGALFWPKAQQYKHAIPVNEQGLQCNCNLYDLQPAASVSTDVLAGILNSSLVILSKLQYGRPVGVEGNLKTEVVDTNMMQVPDPQLATPAARARVAAAFAAMKDRSALQLLSERRLREMALTAKGKPDQLAKLPDTSELDQPDRHELDDAVLELLGVPTRRERDDWMARIYGYLAEHFEQTRRKEEKAIANKKHTARRGAVRPGELAAELWAQIGSEPPHLLRRYDPNFLDRTQPFDTYDVPTEGTPDEQSTLFAPHGVAFTRGASTLAVVPTRVKEQARLLVLLAESGVRGLVRVPHEPAECNQVRDRYQSFLQSREEQLRRLIEERTSDSDMQDKVLALLDQKLLAVA